MDTIAKTSLFLQYFDSPMQLASELVSSHPLCEDPGTTLVANSAIRVQQVLLNIHP